MYIMGLYRYFVHSNKINLWKPDSLSACLFRTVLIVCPWSLSELCVCILISSLLIRDFLGIILKLQVFMPHV